MIANHLHLTLTNIIKDQSYTAINEVLQLQSLLKRGLLDLNSIVTPEINTIHHSLVDFLPPEEFSGDPSGIANYKHRHQKLIQEIDRIINKEISIIKDANIVINSAYKGEKSIAIEAYPSPDIIQFAKSVANKIKTRRDYPRVKGFPPENPYKFAINAMRFLRDLEKKEENNMIKIVSVINDRLKAEPLKFDLKTLSLVVSDDFLSNPNPTIKQYYIKKS